MKFEIRKSVNGKFYFVFKARNGKTIATSEMYESKQACRKGIKSIRKGMFAKTVDLTELSRKELKKNH